MNLITHGLSSSTGFQSKWEPFDLDFILAGAVLTVVLALLFTDSTVYIVCRTYPLRKC